MKPTQRPFVALSLLLVALVASSPALARMCADVTMPNSVTVDGTTLVLNGMGIREATAFQVDVYVAGLYLEERSRSASAILASDTRKRIHMQFVHEVSRDDIVEAMREGFRNNAPGTPSGDIARLTGYMRALDVGDTMTFTYVPGQGTEIKVDGAVRGTIPGVEFARGLFSLYIGPRPPNAGLRTGLLGGRCG